MARKKRESYPQMYVGFKKDKSITIRFTDAQSLSVIDLTRMYQQSLKAIQIVYRDERLRVKNEAHQKELESLEKAEMKSA